MIRQESSFPGAKHMAMSAAQARLYGKTAERAAPRDHDPYEEHEEQAPAANAAYETPEFDNALRLAHHAQRLKAMELGFEHFSQGLASFKTEQRQLFRRQTVISFSIGAFCFATTLIMMTIAISSHHAAPRAQQLASTAPLPATAPAYTPPSQMPAAPLEPMPALNPQAMTQQQVLQAQAYEAPAAMPPAYTPPQQAAPVQAQLQAPVQAYASASRDAPQGLDDPQAALDMPVAAPPVYKPVVTARAMEPVKPAHKAGPLETAVTQHLALTGQALPESWSSLFTHDGNDQRAKLEIAAKFLKGEDVKVDSTYAVSLIRQAAGAGNKEAMMWLAYSYQAGTLNGKPDPVSAAQWFSAAAKAGVTGAYAELGRLYEKGVDGAPDPETALSWYQRAAKAGDTTADAAIQRLNQSLLAQNGMVSANPPPAQAPMLAPQQASARVQPRTNPNAYKEVAQRAMPVAASIPQPAPAAAEEPTPLSDSTAQERGADIRAAQRMLKVLGYKIDKADGALGTQTQAAIRGYQRDHAAYPDGQFTPELLENLTRDIRFGQ